MNTIAHLHRPGHLAATIAACLVLAGCASLSPDSGFDAVQHTARDRLGHDVSWVRTEAERIAADQRVAELLGTPLSAEAAVQIALLNNRGLQASFDELGIADADRVQAGLLPNPGFTFGRLRQGAGSEIDRSLTFNLSHLLTMPMARDIAGQRLEQTRGAAIISVLSLASRTRKAYFTALAAEESVRYMLQVQSAAEAGAELARRQAQTGNWNKLQQAREQGFYADAALNLARAEQVRGEAREQLTRLLGLWGEQTRFRLPERMPELPASASELPDIERTAMAQRMDVQAARLRTEQVAKSLGLTRATRFVNALELGVMRNSFSEDQTERGFEISVELPLFDWGTARVARAEAIYMQSVNRAAQTAVDARSEVRGVYANYRIRHDIARHYRDEIVPLKKRISDENLLRYNGMLIGVFELLADARSQITSVNGYIEALRDFWLAQADLDSAQLGPVAGSGLSQAMSTPSAAPDGAAGSH
ncbi:MAG TPA: TolC family protein [Burkholderiaceae bacterium]|nr:TolC family protein [Burkholderiaceae bacterium]